MDKSDLPELPTNSKRVSKKDAGVRDCKAIHDGLEIQCTINATCAVMKGIDLERLLDRFLKWRIVGRV